MRFAIKKTLILFLVALTATGYGQDDNSDRKLTVDVGADLVSSYVWRGMYQAGVSFQPELSLSVYGFTIGAWGSAGFPEFAKELDFYFSYQFERFKVGISDYWWSGEGTSYFKNSGSHHIEANLGYTISEQFPLSLEVNTFLTGEEDKNDSGGNNFSTYISASFPFSINSMDFETGIGVSPWKGMYGSCNKLNVVAITARATKNLQLSYNYTLPVFVELTFSPSQDNAFFVFGIQF